jgi:hypothetical protein
MVIFLIGIAAVYGISKAALVQRNTVTTRSDQLRSARIALEYIRRDVMNAGLGYHRTGGNIPDNGGNAVFGLTSDGDTDRDLLTAIMAGNNLTTNSLNTDPNARMDSFALITRDRVFNGGNILNYSGASASSNSINIAIDTTKSPTGTQDCRAFDVYLFEVGGATATTQVIGMATSIPNATTIQLSPGDPLSVNQSATASGFAQSQFVASPGAGTIKKIRLVTYSITNNGVLVRKTYGNRAGQPANQQIETREMVYGVSDFQVKYFLEDGTLVDDPSNNNNGRTNQMRMNNVVQVQISITIMPNEPSDKQNKASTPLTIKEYISTKNLRYEVS